MVLKLVEPDQAVRLSESKENVCWHQRTVSETIELLATDPDQGLDTREAKIRLKRHGPNELTRYKTTTPFILFVRQFTSSLILLLMLAALLSGLLGDYKDMFVIIVIILLNGFIAFHQEYRAEQGLAELKKLATPATRVRRGGLWTEIAARELVPGDIVNLETGQLIPADGRIYVSQNLRVQEAAMTGESQPVEKHSERISDSDAQVADRLNMVYMGTAVAYGRGTFIVTSTGDATELGRISHLLQQLCKETTPLQERMRQLGRQLVFFAIILILIIFLVGLLQGVEVRLMFFTAVSLAVAAVPEGLPAVVTIALALGAQRMLKRKALIRRLPAVETLGVVTVICSDKTGTLTENRMSVSVIDVLTDRLEFSHKRELDTGLIRKSPSIALLLAGASLCNDAVVQPEEGDPSRLKTFGDPTEAAFLIAGMKFGLEKQVLENEIPRVAEIPFTSERKRMTTLHRRNFQRERVLGLLFSACPVVNHSPYIAFTKGAVDSMLEVSTRVWSNGTVEDLTEESRKRIHRINDDLASQGMRVLGVALNFLDVPESNEKSVEKDLIFIGLAGMIDPPRPEAREAVKLCKDAGIRPVMITGDHPLTAKYVAKELAIDSDQIVTGSKLSSFSSAELDVNVNDVSIYARISPEHKLKIVQALQNDGHVVAVTGDGVNDAPALKKADIGVAMGITGTDVAKEAADMILMDDNFATLVAAVSEGRRIYDNIRKFLRYILATNSAELWVMILASLLGMPLALLPLQILWINLVTDGLPALALSFEPAERNVMRRAPYNSKESMFSRGLGWRIIWSGLLMGIVVTAAGYWPWSLKNLNWQTMIFTTLTFTQMGSVLAIRSERDSLFRIGILTNKPLLGAVVVTVLLQFAVVYLPVLQSMFSTKPLSMAELGISFVCTLVVFLILEFEKWLVNRRSTR